MHRTSTRRLPLRPSVAGPLANGRGQAAHDESLDKVRWTLMLLGVVLHASLVYAPGGGWLLSDTETSPVLGLLGDAIHVFRMPAFFCLSGYFLARSLARRAPRQVLQARARRLLLPLLVVWLSLNLLQALLLGVHKGQTVMQVLQQGVSLGHLWFLVDLMLLSALAVALWGLAPARWLRVWPAVLRPQERPTWPAPRRTSLAALMGAIACFGLAAYVLQAAVRVTGLAYVEPLGLTSAYRLSNSLPFFAAGMFIALRAHASVAMRLAPGWLAPVGVVLVLACAALSPGQPRWAAEGLQLLQVMGTAAAVLGTIGLLKRLLAPLRLPIDRGSNAPYSIYLMHHVVVVLAAMELLRWNLPVALKFGFVVLAALVVPWLIHEWLIRRQPWLALLFNGVRLPRTDRAYADTVLLTPVPAGGAQTGG